MNLKLYDPAETDPEAYQAALDEIDKAALIKCGGPAFPVTDMSKTQCAGISIRDWFAGQVLSTIIADERKHMSITVQEMAFAAYEYADAMLAARKDYK